MLTSLRARILIGLGLAVLSVASQTEALAQPVNCPQPRFTGRAPDDYFARVSPLGPATDANTKAGEELFMGKNRAANCVICHGKSGDGKGALSSQYDPPPRNFACAATINGVVDGQLFWIIRFGSPGTAMPPHPRLNDDQVWQLVQYLRGLAK
jgi:mono/diheme cytochrome c family protein